MAAPAPERVAATIRALLARRRPGASLCPSEVARALAADAPAWRALLPLVRAVAGELARQGRLEVSRGGRPVDPADPRGPVRLALPRGERFTEG